MHFNISFPQNKIVISQQDRINRLRGLSSLNLSYNNIAGGLQGLLDMNIYLEEFNIRNNMLRSIDENTFQVAGSF